MYVFKVSTFLMKRSSYLQVNGLSMLPATQLNSWRLIFSEARNKLTAKAVDKQTHCAINNLRISGAMV